MAQTGSPSTAQIDFVEERATGGRALEPDNLRNDLDVCCELLRRTMGSRRLGFWTDGMRWVSARYQTTQTPTPNHETSVTLGIISSRDVGSGHRTDTLGVSCGIRGQDTRLESSWTAIRHRLAQVAVAMRTWFQLFKAKWLRGRRKMQ